MHLVGAVRKHEIEVGGFARDMSGEVCRVIAVRELIDGTREFTVRYHDGPPRLLLEGFLEHSTGWAAP